MCVKLWRALRVLTHRQPAAAHRTYLAHTVHVEVSQACLFFEP